MTTIWDSDTVEWFKGKIIQLRTNTKIQVHGNKSRMPKYAYSDILKGSC